MLILFAYCFAYLFCYRICFVFSRLVLKLVCCGISELIFSVALMNLGIILFQRLCFLTWLAIKTKISVMTDINIKFNTTIFCNVWLILLISCKLSQLVNKLPFKILHKLHFFTLQDSNFSFIRLQYELSCTTKTVTAEFSRKGKAVMMGEGWLKIEQEQTFCTSTNCYFWQQICLEFFFIVRDFYTYF